MRKLCMFLLFFGFVVAGVFGQVAEVSATGPGRLYLRPEQTGSSTYSFYYGQCHVDIAWTNSGIIGEKVFGTAQWSALPSPAQISVNGGSVDVDPSGGKVGWSYIPHAAGQGVVSIDNGHISECLYTVSVGVNLASYKAHIAVKALWADNWQPIECGDSDGCRYQIGKRSGSKFPDEFMAEGIPYTQSIGVYGVNFAGTVGPGGAKLIQTSPTDPVEVKTGMVFYLLFERRPALQHVRR